MLFYLFGQHAEEREYYVRYHLRFKSKRCTFKGRQSRHGFSARLLSASPNSQLYLAHNELRKADSDLSEWPSVLLIQIKKGASFELKACCDNHPAGFVDQPVKRKPCPLVKPAAGKKESNGEVVCQVSKVAAALLA